MKARPSWSVKENAGTFQSMGRGAARKAEAQAHRTQRTAEIILITKLSPSIIAARPTRRKARERLEGLLLEGLDSPTSAMTRKDWVQLKKNILERRAKRPSE